jgi:uncharacterized membrane protein required for colicin V production
MEWFWKIVDHLQKSLAGSALQSFALSDWVFLCVIFWGLVQGSRKGFSDMFGKLLGIFLVSMLTLSFYPSGASYLTANLPALPQQVAETFSFFLLAVFFWLSVSWCINVFGKVLKVEAQGILKTMGGSLLGVFRMLLLLSFLAQFLLLFPIKAVQQIFEQGRTYAGYTISRFVPDLHTLVGASFGKPVLKKPAESHKVGG